MSESYWPHAPMHKLGAAGAYLVTASTYQKKPFFADGKRLDALHGGLLKYAGKYGWRIEAWAVFSNHYHFVGHSPEGEDTAESLQGFVSELHKKSASWVNAQDGTGAKGRKVWHNYRETHLTFEKSYLARLNYVHQNAVKHGLVTVANEYRWCSAAWFERVATRAQVNTIYSIKTDRIKVQDEFEV